MMFRSEPNNNYNLLDKEPSGCFSCLTGIYNFFAGKKKSDKNIDDLLELGDLADEAAESIEMMAIPNSPLTAKV